MSQNAAIQNRVVATNPATGCGSGGGLKPPVPSRPNPRARPARGRLRSMPRGRNGKSFQATVESWKAAPLIAVNTVLHPQYPQAGPFEDCHFCFHCSEPTRLTAGQGNRKNFMLDWENRCGALSNGRERVGAPIRERFPRSSA